jgi:hypothetical protein
MPTTDVIAAAVKAPVGKGADTVVGADLSGCFLRRLARGVASLVVAGDAWVALTLVNRTLGFQPTFSNFAYYPLPILGNQPSSRSVLPT